MTMVEATLSRKLVIGARWFALPALLIICGREITHGYGRWLVIGVVGAGFYALVFTRRGVLIGLLLLAAMNGVPFVDTSSTVSGRLALQDVAVIVLILTAVAWILFDGSFHCPNRAARMLSRAGVLLLFWWLWTLFRTVLIQHVHALAAGTFVRDFFFFALLLILLPRVRLTSRDIGLLLGVLTVGVCIFAVVQIMATTGIAKPGHIIHFEKNLRQSGFTRLYSRMTDLVTAGVAVSLAASLLARRAAVRLIALPVALLLLTSTVVQLTRARWIGLVIGIIVVSIWLMTSGDLQIASALRRRLGAIAGALAIGAVVSALVVPGIASGGTVINRLLSVFTDVQTGGGTVAVRESASRLLTGYLGGKWPFGLGFIPPSAHYFSGLALGSIRDSDLGVLNAVMTMGVIGAVLVYFPVVAMLAFCLRRTTTGWSGQYSWLRYGGAIWIVATLASSITLITLFSASGLVLTALATCVLAHPSVSGSDIKEASTYLEPRSQASAAIYRQLDGRAVST